MERLDYKNIFEAITEDASEAADLEFRADLMLVLRQLFESKKWDQARIGEALGIPQPRVSELMRGKVSTVSADKLIGYLAKLGYRFKPTYRAVARGNKAPIQCDVKAYAQAA